jgi:hypothetical protein
MKETEKNGKVNKVMDATLEDLEWVWLFIADWFVLFSSFVSFIYLLRLFIW